MTHLYWIVRTDSGRTLFYIGKCGGWTTVASNATPFTGDAASVICENMSTRGIEATFRKTR